MKFKSKPQTFIKNLSVQFPNIDIEFLIAARELTSQKYPHISIGKFLSSYFRWMEIAKLECDIDITRLEEMLLARTRWMELQTSLGKRLDQTNPSSIDVYINDITLSTNIYKEYCSRKTTKMVDVMKSNPSLCDTRSLTAIASRHGTENAQSIFEQRNMNSSKQLKISYFIEMGMTEEEARIALSNRQSTFSLQKCIDLHGDEKGTEIWKDRQDRWQTTINSKSEEEKLEINQKKGVTLRNMVRKYGDVEGEQRYKKWLKKVYNNNYYRFFSLESIKFFESFIPPNILDKSNHSENEWFLRDANNIYFYDLKYKNVIVEYNGHHVHPNTEILTEQELSNWKHAYNGSGYEQCVEKDRIKRELAINNGFIFFEVFSNDTKEVIEETKNLILQALSSAE